MKETQEINYREREGSILEIVAREGRHLFGDVLIQQLGEEHPGIGDRKYIPGRRPSMW